MSLLASTTSDFLEQVNSQTLDFSEVLAFIESHYDYQPVAFSNGQLTNNAGDNEGSAKVFGFARLQNLDEQTTLMLFCEHYQQVLATPDDDTHANIRNFMTHGWAGLNMPSNPLRPRA